MSIFPNLSTCYVHPFYSDCFLCRNFTAGWFHPFETWAKLSSWFTTRLWAALLLSYHTGMIMLICSLVCWAISYRLLFSLFTNKLALISMLLCCHVYMLDTPPSLITCFHVKPWMMHTTVGCFAKLLILLSDPTLLPRQHA